MLEIASFMEAAKLPSQDPKRPLIKMPRLRYKQEQKRGAIVEQRRHGGVARLIPGADAASGTDESRDCSD